MWVFVLLFDYCVNVSRWYDDVDVCFRVPFGCVWVAGGDGVVVSLRRILESLLICFEICALCRFC